MSNVGWVGVFVQESSPVYFSNHAHLEIVTRGAKFLVSSASGKQ